MMGRLPGHSKSRNLLMCKGHIVIVGKSVQRKVPSMCVWLLEWKTMKWREAGRMPQWMSDHFVYHTSQSFYSCSHGDLIFLISNRCSPTHGHKCILFDMAQNTWRCVGDWKNFQQVVMSFEPRLDSQV